MRSSLKSIIAVAAAFLVVPSFASADDVGGGNDLQEVMSRMSDLEQQLKATNDALAASTAKVNQQQKMLSKLGTSNQSGPMAALSNFLTETTFGGHVSASYFYNLNDPDSGRTMDANSGTIGANPYHPNHNSFQVDQVWFSMSNEATPESRGGFEIDIVYGQAADRLALGIDGNTLFDYLYNANVSYLAPITDAGIKVTAGRFETHTGTESAQDTAELQHHARPALHAAADQLHGCEALGEVRQRLGLDARCLEQLGIRDARLQPVRAVPECPELRHG